MRIRTQSLEAGHDCDLILSSSGIIVSEKRGVPDITLEYVDHYDAQSASKALYAEFGCGVEAGFLSINQVVSHCNEYTLRDPVDAYEHTIKRQLCF